MAVLRAAIIYNSQPETGQRGCLVFQRARARATIRPSRAIRIFLKMASIMLPV